MTPLKSNISKTGQNLKLSNGLKYSKLVFYPFANNLCLDWIENFTKQREWQRRDNHRAMRR